jgi:hypothetical protein
MLKYLLLAVCASLCLLSPAEARHRHHQHYTYHHHHHRHYQRVAQPACADLFCLFGASQQQPARYTGRSHSATHGAAHSGFASRSSGFAPRSWTATRPTVARQTVSYGSFDSAIGRPARYIAGRLACALNVGSALAERGIRGTGSAAALSYLHWGRSAGGPVPGAVIVSSRRGGGHVAIVSRVVNGQLMAWNATGGNRGWQEIPYRLRVLDYRVPG